MKLSFKLCIFPILLPLLLLSGACTPNQIARGLRMASTNLAKSKPKGQLTLTSEPTGGEISINKENIGLTPHSIYFLATNQDYEISIKWKGSGVVRRVIQLKPDKVTHFHAEARGKSKVFTSDEEMKCSD